MDGRVLDDRSTGAGPRVVAIKQYELDGAKKRVQSDMRDGIRKRKQRNSQRRPAKSSIWKKESMASTTNSMRRDLKLPYDGICGSAAGRMVP